MPTDARTQAAAGVEFRPDGWERIKTELLLMKWMLGFVLALQIVIAVRLFTSCRL
jgi:hypothetical protein